MSTAGPENRVNRHFSKLDCLLHCFVEQKDGEQSLAAAICMSESDVIRKKHKILYTISYTISYTICKRCMTL